MAIIISHSHVVHAAFGSSPFCQTFDQMMLDRVLLEQSVFKVVRGVNTGSQMVRDGKRLGTTGLVEDDLRETTCCLRRYSK